ncbi:MAG: tetratricopeptide repeat protein [Bacteroidales bacterium]|nr:tetratricopeptide repeat protein [Bacteroidales bacterium]
MKRLIIAIFVFLSSVAVWAAAIDDAKALYRSGNYDAAIVQLTSILKKAPANATANYYMGLCQLETGEVAKAKEYFRKAEDKGSYAASQQLAQLAIEEYQFDVAEKHFATWEKLLKKERKTDPAIDRLRMRVSMLQGMLGNVEKIAIIDSLVVDSVEFFKYYKLSEEAGHIYEGAFLPPAYTDSMPRMVFLPQSNTELFWAQPNSRGQLELVSAQILDDGSVQAPVPMGASLGAGGDADFPFFDTDGITFYFASNGRNSIGGYDIFMSRRQSDGTVFEPQNMGMPYNSAYDDYMLVIDDAAGLGWWATDRNQIPGKVTIYVFVPNETRINYDADDPDIADYAFIRDIEATQVDFDGDIEELLNNPLIHSAKESGEDELTFVLPMGNGKVYRRLNDFNSPKARQAMLQYLARLKDFEDMKTKLVAMRLGYGNGDKAVGPEILSMEKRLLSAETLLFKLRNQVVQMEGR